MAPKGSHLWRPGIRQPPQGHTGASMLAPRGRSLARRKAMGVPASAPPWVGVHVCAHRPCAHRKPITLSPSSPQEYSQYLLFLLISGGPPEPLTPYPGETGRETTGAGGRGICPPLCLRTPGIQGSRLCHPKLPLAGPKPCRHPCTYSRPPVTASGHFPPAHLPRRSS